MGWGWRHREIGRGTDGWTEGWGGGEMDRGTGRWMGKRGTAGQAGGGAEHLPGPLPHLHVAVEFPEHFVSQDLVDGWLGHRLQSCSTEGEQSVTPRWEDTCGGGLAGSPSFPTLKHRCLPKTLLLLLLEELVAGAGAGQEQPKTLGMERGDLGVAVRWPHPTKCTPSKGCPPSDQGRGRS